MVSRAYNKIAIKLSYASTILFTFSVGYSFLFSNNTFLQISTLIAYIIILFINFRMIFINKKTLKRKRMIKYDETINILNRYF